MMSQNIGLLLLRASFSLAMMGHGWEKLANFESVSARFMSFAGLGPKISLGLAIVGELFAPLLVLLGVCTRWACLPVIVTMITAWYMQVFAWNNPWDKQELPALYLAAFVAIALIGPGDWSLEKRCCKKKR